jgi:hypothetical protein
MKRKIKNGERTKMSKIKVLTVKLSQNVQVGRRGRHRRCQHKGPRVAKLDTKTDEEDTGYGSGGRVHRCRAMQDQEWSSCEGEARAMIG